MGSIRKRERSNLLFFDFRYKNIRCREQTKLPDTPANRKKLQTIMDKIDAEILLGHFKYENYFPESSMLKKVQLQNDT
ncbi:MAG: DUF3596 domain-containing protein, partial [Ignavibacteriae bacterium]|nr:DUF3596 domain-containing protein [Ignavibacteriota bacterium]